jgi:hypothetical protein
MAGAEFELEAVVGDRPCPSSIVKSGQALEKSGRLFVRAKCTSF